MRRPEHQGPPQEGDQLSEQLARLSGRKERMAEHARQERSALAELDRAATRLEAAIKHRNRTVAEAEEAVVEARQAHERALGSYARCAGHERAARFLGLEERELRRLAKEAPQ